MPERAKVAHIITRLIVGGAQEMVLLAAGGVDPARFHSHVIAGPETGLEGSLREEFDAAGIPVTIVHDLVREVAPWRDVRALRQIAHAIRDSGFDIIHTHAAKAGILGREAAAHVGARRVVHHLHGWSFSGSTGLKRRLYIAAERRAARHTRALVAVTDRDIGKGLGAGIGRRDQYRVIRAAVDLSRFPPSTPERRRAARQRLGLADADFVVGSVGRLASQKAPLDLVRAVSIAHAREPLKLVLVGDGPMRPQVEEALAHSGLAASSVLTGVRRDVEDILPAFDVLASASLWEGLPRTLIEAMSVGVPVVATAVDGVCEIVVEEQTGLLTQPGEPAQLADGILRIRAEPELAERLVSGARREICEYSVERMVAQLEELYTELMGE